MKFRICEKAKFTALVVVGKYKATVLRSIAEIFAYVHGSKNDHRMRYIDARDHRYSIDSKFSIQIYVVRSPGTVRDVHGENEETHPQKRFFLCECDIGSGVRCDK